MWYVAATLASGVDADGVDADTQCPGRKEVNLSSRPQGRGRKPGRPRKAQRLVRREGGGGRESGGDSTKPARRSGHAHPEPRGASSLL